MIGRPERNLVDVNRGDIRVDAPTPASIVLFGAANGVLVRLVDFGIVHLDRVMAGPREAGRQMP
jgi:hypothetical protein